MKKVFRVALAGCWLALALLLPNVTGGIPKIGNMLCPMHLPVFLCGLTCGPWYGLAVGAVAPLLRSVLFGMPSMVPKAICMALELATYGVTVAVFSHLLPKRFGFLYVSLMMSMLAGRLVWGLARWMFYIGGSSAFTLKMFWVSGFATAFPGILLQLILIPILMRIFEGQMNSLRRD